MGKGVEIAPQNAPPCGHTYAHEIARKVAARRVSPSTMGFRCTSQKSAVWHRIQSG
jgi:hypothetical protein